ncbi:VOC family protein [Nocardia sp. NBC_00508]|uniref:VOC family protein n=1 Tax=Nocardia sp. NBC_00508 TaxID=2975992 RepID=UPI002E80813D|nr:VOC family protein [Nocardia sp. NBC_00508]WUD67753.1 VOC family protein [Nocardia sp. NBC_00508]
MTAGLQTIIYPVTDLAKAKSVFAALLGVDPIADTPYYVGYRVAGQDIGLDPNGHAGKGMTGPIGYWHVEDIEKRIAALVEAGATVDREPKDVGGGKLIATITDADGNMIGLLQP